MSRGCKAEFFTWRLKVKRYSSPEQVISELRGVICHMGSQCYLPPHTSEHSPPDPIQTGWYTIYLPWRDGRLSLLRRLVTYRNGVPVSRQSVTHPGSNHARCSLTLLIETKLLTTTPHCHPNLQDPLPVALMAKATVLEVKDYSLLVLSQHWWFSFGTCR